MLESMTLWLALVGQPPVPGDWRQLPELTDAFDGERLDADKWWDHNPGWQGRQPAWFAPHNVAVRDGLLHLTLRAENLPDLPPDYHTFTSAAVKSKAKVLYGYFEARCRPMRSRGSSAFWFYDSTPAIWTEIDVFEIGAAAPGHERTVHQNLHVFHTPTVKEHLSAATRHQVDHDLADRFHTYGLLWTPERIVFYLDGQVTRESPNVHHHQPLYLNFDSETMPTWFGLPDPAELPATFSIEWVRAWALAEVTQVEAD